MGSESDDKFTTLSEEVGFGTPIDLSETPTKEELQGFPRAMKLLDLKPHMHESQDGEALELGWSDGALDGDGGPRSTLLLRNKETPRWWVLSYQARWIVLLLMRDGCLSATGCLNEATGVFCSAFLTHCQHEDARVSWFLLACALNGKISFSCTLTSHSTSELQR